LTRLTLKQRIINIIDNAPRGYSEELAKISGYSSGSNLKKVLKSEEKEFDKFNGLLELVKHLFNEDEHKMMEQYSKEIDPNNKTARSMLEYLSCNRLLDSMKELLDKMSECKNKESKEWAKVYLIQWNWQMNYHTLNVDDFLKSVSEVKTSVTEMKTFVKLQQCYGYYLKKRHVVAYDISQDIEQDIEECSLGDVILSVSRSHSSYIPRFTIPDELLQYTFDGSDGAIPRKYSRYFSLVLKRK
jgi:hypothetical protein